MRRLTSYNTMIAELLLTIYRMLFSWLLYSRGLTTGDSAYPREWQCYEREPDVARSWAFTSDTRAHCFRTSERAQKHEQRHDSGRSTCTVPYT